MKFTRITIDPKQMGGVSCLRGLRVPVATLGAIVLIMHRLHESPPSGLTRGMIWPAMQQPRAPEQLRQISGAR
jgi:hypothetical protein